MQTFTKNMFIKSVRGTTSKICLQNFAGLPSSTTAGSTHQGKTPKHRVWGKNPLKNQQKPAANLIQFQFVMPVIIKHFFMFTASNDQYVMN